MTLIAMAVAALVAQPQAAEAQAPPTPESPLKFVKNIHRWYPERARARRIAGQAMIDCDHGPGGVLLNCAIVSETPENSQFSLAAWRMAEVKAVTLNQAAAVNQGGEGRRVRVVLHFQYPRIW